MAFGCLIIIAKEKNMLGRQTPQDLLDSYRKKRQLLPVFISILAILLVVIGLVIIILWLTGGGISFNLFSKEPTPTSTLPPTPVLSPTPSLEPTEIPTLTPTVSPTPSGPIEYEVQEFDTFWAIAEKFDVDFETLLAINNCEDGQCPFYPGLMIVIPAPGQTLPTPTPIPLDLQSGTKINYRTRLGDTLALIASRYNTTIDDIQAQNRTVFRDIEDINNIPVGLELVIRVNIVTPTPTFAPTSTLAS